jgi:hypothetical protein
MNFYAEAFVQLAQASVNQGVLTGLAENRAASVARDDVAAAAAGILIGDGHAGAIYNATGPERLSGAERAGVIAEITGRPIAFRVITEEQLRAGLTKAGLPAGAVNFVVSIQASFGGGCVRHSDRRRRAPWLPAAQASPRRACWGAEISFGLKTCTRTDLLSGWGWQAGTTRCTRVSVRPSWGRHPEGRWRRDDLVAE